MARNLSRDANLYVQVAGTAIGSSSDANTWEVPVLDGFSFSQDTATQDIAISEAGATPTRGMKQYNTALNPVEFSFAVYVKPYIKVDSTSSPIAAERASSVEHILWNALASDTLGVGNSAFANVAASGIAESGTIAAASNDEPNNTIDFGDSDTHELLLLDFFFKFANNTYKITSCQIDTAEISFDIDGIAMITWSGSGLTQAEVSGADHTTIDGWTALTDYYPAPSSTITGCVKNRFTTMVVVDETTSPDTYYTIPITGGSLTISNNISYLTPEELGRVNTPCGSFTGSRNISGNLTAYMNTLGSETGADEANGYPTGKLLTDVLALTDATNNSFNITIRMGGTASDKARVDFKVPTAQLVIPTINVEDVISTEIAFLGQGSTGVEATDEITVVYVPAVTDLFDDT